MNIGLFFQTMKLRVPPGGTVPIERPFRAVSCLAASQPFRLSFREGGFGDFEAGLGLDLPATVEAVDVVNLDPVRELEVTLALGDGAVRDARLTASGRIDVVQSLVQVATEEHTDTAGTAVATGSNWTGARWLFFINRSFADVLLRNTDAAGPLVGFVPARSATWVPSDGIPKFAGPDTGTASFAIVGFR